MSASKESTGFWDKPLPKDIWLLRPCELYKEEYSDCESVGGRFHQYYIHGSKQDCRKWKEDFENCMAFRQSPSEEVVEKILQHERERREERLSNARDNDVWEYRKEAPSDWNAPVIRTPQPGQTTILGKIQETHASQGTLSQTEKQSMCIVS
ncbi:synaptic plasticity regulator PANTS-like [Haliotis asinina]|uniref:synaptic plasticity regulator PANTS-like n=1 Tax=Haliotis asinina TaxID=109174 RepID=UPI003531E28C